jgi:hypothetical protein
MAVQKPVPALVVGKPFCKTARGIGFKHLVAHLREIKERQSNDQDSL